MSVHEEIREQQKKLKDQSFKAKLEYFWEYYKVHTLVVICVLIFAYMLIHDVLTSKPYGFYAIMLNSGASAAQDYLEKEFIEYSEFDSENYECLIDTSASYNLKLIDDVTVATSQKIVATIAAADLDVMVADYDLFTHYANQETLSDLRLYFSDTELKELEDRLFYVDQAYLDYLSSDDYQNYISTGEFDPSNKYAVMADNYNKDFTLPETDPTKMQNPVPVGINMSDSATLSNYGVYSGSTPVAGIIINTKRSDMAVKFIEYLMK